MLVTPLPMVTLVRLGAVRESLVADAGDTVWDGDAGQAPAVIESSVANAGDTVADGDAGQAAAAFES